jgi:membrane-bound lytic murein transglycosylase D
MDEFRALNPSFNRPVIPGVLQPNILLPADRAEIFTGNLAAWEATGQPLASWTGYTLQPGETLAQVARRAGVSEAQLREANRVPPRFRLASGSTILIPRDETMADDIPAALVNASFALLPEHANLRQVTYRVRRGDTLRAVAARWNVRPEEIVAWNNLRGETLFAGQRLTLTVPRAPARPAAAPRAAQPRQPAAAPATASSGSSPTRPGAAAAARPVAHTGARPH